MSFLEIKLKEFDEKFVHKGEDSNDPESEWTWNIVGSYPFEIKSFLTSTLQEFAEKIRLEEEPTDHNEELMYGDTDYSLNTINAGKNEAKYILDGKIAELLKGASSK